MSEITKQRRSRRGFVAVAAAAVAAVATLAGGSVAYANPATGPGYWLEGNHWLGVEAYVSGEPAYCTEAGTSTVVTDGAWTDATSADQKIAAERIAEQKGPAQR